MPSFSISQFTVLPGPLRVSAEFLILSTGPLFYLIYFTLTTLDTILRILGLKNNFRKRDIPAIDKASAAGIPFNENQRYYINGNGLNQWHNNKFEFIIFCHCKIMFS